MTLIYEHDLNGAIMPYIYVKGFSFESYCTNIHKHTHAER